jgi:hypothetical protein
MKNFSLRFLPLLFVMGLLAGCQQNQKIIIDDAAVLHNNQDQLTEVIIYDVFTPPVASRIYGILRGHTL